jgi:hypothetical protein
MPRISFFRGIAILMFSNEAHHSLAHFHARYAEHQAVFGLDGQPIAGSLPRPQLRAVREWALLHQAELAHDWELAQAGERVDPIDPLP